MASSGTKPLDMDASLKPEIAPKFPADAPRGGMFCKKCNKYFTANDLGDDKQICPSCTGPLERKLSQKPTATPKGIPQNDLAHARHGLDKETQALLPK